MATRTFRPWKGDPPILADAETALRTASIERFMVAVEQLARAVSAGTTTWDELGPWAREHGNAFLAAKPSLGAWETEMGTMFYSRGGEEGTHLALRMRSQHAFARSLFE